MATRRQDLVGDLLAIGSKLPSRVSALVAAFAFLRQSRSTLIEPRATTAMSPAALSWRDFERLVGEAFRHRGFTVTGFGASASDGGVDLGLAKNGERFLVQCKHWRKPQVDVTVIRELSGIIRALGANGGYVITAGQFTREARTLADACRITLIDEFGWGALIAGVKRK
jgi:restriction system protein